MKVWIVFVHHKELELCKRRDRLNISFKAVIIKIESFKYIIIDSPSQKHVDQQSFLVKVNDYPFVVPFRLRGEVLQLITIFPDR